VTGRFVLRKLPEPLANWLRSKKDAVYYRGDPKRYFHEVFDNNKWCNEESVSGPGSTLEATKNIRREMPALLRALQIKTLVDAPCGDCNWISTCLPKEIAYIGGDIVNEIVQQNRMRYPHFGEFRLMDIINDKLPTADAILVRDCLIHLPNELALKALKNIYAADIKYLFSTSYVLVQENEDVEIGDFRRINLQLSPFLLPEPDYKIFENFEEEFGRILGVWRLRP